NPGALLLLRLNVALHRGTQVTSQIFIHRYQEVTQTKWDGSHESVKKFIQTIGKTVYDNAWRSRKDKIRNQNVDCWDITILAGFIKSLERRFFVDTGKT
ncbi:unnamed protein product, partial [Allacma fusca]